MAHFVSAEVDHLKKLQAAKPKEEESEEIPRPTKITSLQDAMGLTENKKLYSFCRVSFLFFSFNSFTSDALVVYRRLFEMFWFVQMYQSMSTGEVKILPL